MTTHKPLSQEWLDSFNQAREIIRTGKNEAGARYSQYGKLNQAAWIGEHADLLLNEITRLKAELEAYEKCPEAMNAFNNAHMGA